MTLYAERRTLNANKLALNWLCFFAVSKHEILHNHLSYKALCQFRPTANWLCFFKLTTNFRRFSLISPCFSKKTAGFTLIFALFFSCLSCYPVSCILFVKYYTNINTKCRVNSKKISLIRRSLFSVRSPKDCHRGHRRCPERSRRRTQRNNH